MFLLLCVNGKGQDNGFMENSLPEQANTDVGLYDNTNQIPSDTANKPLPFLKSRYRSTFIFDNGITMDKTAFKLFLSGNYIGHLWIDYANAQRLSNAGTTTLIGCVFLEVFGISMATREKKEHLSATSVGMITLGALLGVASIPLFVTGNKREQKVIETYNSQYAGKPKVHYTQQLILKLEGTNNGLGLKLTF
jgi:hypothetical protein